MLDNRSNEWRQVVKKQSRRLSLSRETLYALDPGSLKNPAGGSDPILIALVTVECVALTYATYKLAKATIGG